VGLPALGEGEIGNELVGIGTRFPLFLHPRVNFAPKYRNFSWCFEAEGHSVFIYSPHLKLDVIADGDCFMEPAGGHNHMSFFVMYDIGFPYARLTVSTNVVTVRFIKERLATPYADHFKPLMTTILD
jgi:hypothetical protein